MRLRRLGARAILRIKPIVPKPIRLLYRELSAIAGNRPSDGLPAFRKALVLAPHPDDECLGCGGTIALLTNRGISVNVVFVSDGEALEGTDLLPADIARLRRREGETSCRILGAEAPRFLSLPNLRVPDLVELLAKNLQSIIDELKPDVIFFPWFFDAHIDHRAVSSALSRCDVPASVEVWGYEVWAPLPANRLVDISSVIDRKRAALAAHTADPRLPAEAEGIVGLNRYRSASGLLRDGYAEAFLAAPADRFFAMARQTTER